MGSDGDGALLRVVVAVLDRLEDADAVGDRAAGDVGVEGDGVELVRGAGVQVELDRHAGAAELGRVGEVLVAEDVDLADLDVGRRQAGRVLEAGRRRRGRDVRPAGGVAEQRAATRCGCRRRTTATKGAMCGSGVRVRSSSIGMSRICRAIFGPPRSRARIVSAAAMPPPALSPITPIRSGSTPSSAACSCSQRSAA